MGTCKEKPKAELTVIHEEEHNKKVLVAFAVWLGVTIAVGGLARPLSQKVSRLVSQSQS